MAEREQNYKNHARLLPPFHLFVLPVLLINFLNEIRHVVQDPTRHTAWVAIVAAALLVLAFLARTQALTVQDRVIRVEERMRMRQVLPAELHHHIDTLTPRQIVALRFASDAELADLVRAVVGGTCTTQKEIKTRVKTWRPDWLRA